MKPAPSASVCGRCVAWLARSSGTEANNYGQCAIDVPKLAEREQPMGLAEPARIDGTELLDKDPRPPTVDFHLRPE